MPTVKIPGSVLFARLARIVIAWRPTMMTGHMTRMTAEAATTELKLLRKSGLSCSIQDIQAAARLSEAHQIPALDALGAVEAGKLAINVKTDRNAWNLEHGRRIAEGLRKQIGSSV